MHVLFLEAAVYDGPEPFHVHSWHGYFRSLVILGQHFSYINIFISIVVDIRNVGTHRKEREVVGHGFYFILESSISLIDKKIIIVRIIIGHKNISITIIIQISCKYRKRISEAVINSCLVPYFSELAIIVPI